MSSTCTETVETLSIDGVAFHLVFSGLLPPLSIQDFDSLQRSIQRHGIRKPIHVYGADGGWNVIDGEHRLRIARELGIPLCDVPLIVEDVKFSTAKLLAYSLNMARRQITREQRRDIIARLRRDGLSLRRIADTINVSRSTVLAEVRLLEKMGIELPGEITGEDGKTYPARNDGSDIVPVLAMRPDGAWGLPYEIKRAEIPEYQPLEFDFKALLADIVLRLEQTSSHYALVYPFESFRIAAAAARGIPRALGKGMVFVRSATTEDGPVLYVARGPNYVK